MQRKLKETIILNKYDLKWKEASEKASGNTALNKESIVELMKTVFAITGICKTAVANIKSYWKQTGNHEARNWKATRRDKPFEK